MSRNVLPTRAMILLSALLLTGCGSRTYPVEGKVVWPDGTPAGELAGYRVNFESLEAPVSANGQIEKDGSFRVGTHKPGDGAMPGKHRVAITPPDPLHDVDAPRPKAAIPARFGAFATSKLEVTIERKTNEVTLPVERGR